MGSMGGEDMTGKVIIPGMGLNLGNGSLRKKACSESFTLATAKTPEGMKINLVKISAGVERCCRVPVNFLEDSKAQLRSKAGKGNHAHE